MLTSVRKRNKSSMPENKLVPNGLKLLYDRTVEEEQELEEISDREMSSGSEEDVKVFKLKERLRLKKKAEREQRKANKKVEKMLQLRSRSTDNSSSLVGFVVDEDESDATVSE